MCRPTVEQRWGVNGEEFNKLVNGLISAASHANVFIGLRIRDSVGCVSNDCQLDFVDNKTILYAQQYLDEMIVHPKHHGKYVALYEWQYQCCRSSISKCRAA